MLYPVELRAPALFSAIYSHTRKLRLLSGTALGSAFSGLFNRLNRSSLALISQTSSTRTLENAGPKNLIWWLISLLCVTGGAKWYPG